MRRHTAALPLATAALALLALATPGALALEWVNVEAAFTSIGTLNFTIERAWEGPDADRARVHLDRTMGDGDGLFTIPEEARYLDSERRFPSPPRALTLDGRPGEAGEAEVTLRGALGLVNGPQPVHLRSSGSIAFRLSADAPPTHTIGYTFEAPGAIGIHLPEGWRATDLRGFAEARIVDEGRRVEGRGGPGATGLVIIVREDALPAGSEASASGPLERAREAPGATFLLAGLAGVIALAYLGRRPRRPHGRSERGA